MPEPNSATALIIAAIALGGTVLTAIATLFIAHRSTFLSTVTQNRLKWIEGIRTDFIELNRILHRAGTAVASKEKIEDVSAFIDELRQRISSVTYKLNVYDPVEAFCISILDASLSAIIKAIKAI